MKKELTDQKEINAIEEELLALDIGKASKLSVEEREARLGKYRKDPKQQVTMRLPESVIRGLQVKAEEAGVPYQTFATMILSRYVHGGLLDKDTCQAICMGTAGLPPYSPAGDAATEEKKPQRKVG